MKQARNKIFVLSTGLAMGVTLSSVIAPSAHATGRTIYIPPVFSNKDYACSGSNPSHLSNIKICYDFSLTNLSSINQTVTIAMKTDAGSTFIEGTFPTSSPSSTSDVVWLNQVLDGTPGANLRRSTCVQCNSNGCIWARSLAADGTTPWTGYGIGWSFPAILSPPPAEYDQIFYHTGATFQVSVKEDRGAVIARMTQRIFPDIGTSSFDCRDTYTSPAVVVELNGGRAF